MLYHLVADLMTGELLTDVFTRELFDGHIELIAHIAPEGTHDLVVEGCRLSALHQFICLLQALHGYLVCTSGTLFHDIGILDGTAAEDDKQSHKGGKERRQDNPVLSRAEEVFTLGMLTRVAGMDIVDVAVEQLDILLSCIGTDIAAAALGHIEGEALGGDRLVLLVVDVVIDILDGRNLKLAGMAGHSQEIVDNRTLQTIGGELALVGHLGIILIEVLGELHLRLFQQLHITHTTDDDTYLDRIVGLHLSLVYLCGDVKLTYTAREIGRTGWQRVDIDGDAGCLDLLLHLYIARTAVEESLEGVDITVLLNNDTVERDAGNLQLA